MIENQLSFAPDGVVIFVLDLAVNEQHMYMVIISLEQLALPALAGMELTDIHICKRVALAQDKLVVSYLVRVAQLVPQTKVTLDGLLDTLGH